MTTGNIVITEDTKKRKVSATAHGFTMNYFHVLRLGGNDTWETAESHQGFQAWVHKKPEGFKTKVYNPVKLSYDSGISNTLEEAFASIHRYIAARTR